ncbi:MAG: hypothetical protein HQK87_00580 [Nitrospinae bacterium]|nr:hypothetical protein [Nitrospinota bacterium]
MVLLSRLLSTLVAALLLYAAPSLAAPSPEHTVDRLFAAEGIVPPPFPRRVLWLTLPAGDPATDRRLRSLEEAARQRPSLDVAPADTARFFLKRLADRRTPLTGPPLGDEQKDALALLARRIGAVRVVVAWSEGGGTKLVLLDPAGIAVAAYDDPWRAPSLPVAAAPGATSGATSIATEGGGVFGRPWNGQFAPLVADRSQNMTLRDRVPIRRYPVDEVVQSATVMANPAHPSLTLAYATKSGVKVVGVDGERLVTLAEAGAGEVTPVSLVPYDLDGDGTDELLVNAYREEGLASFVLRLADRRLVPLQQGLPHYFSLTVDGALLAQEGMEDFPAPTMKVSRVTAEEGSLRLVAAVTMTGNEIPVGVNRFDLDGDGAFELAGSGSRGDLLLFTFGGVVTWRGGEFGASPRVVVARKRGAPDRSYAVPPVPQRVIDPTLGPLVVVAGATYAERGLFSTPTLTRGTVWFVRPTPEGYVVEDAYREAEGAVVDLIPMNRGAHARTDAVGFVLTVPGMVRDSGVIVLPVE